MPELPDVEVYVERLNALLGGEVIERVRLASPFLLRSVQPPPSSVEGRRMTEVLRIGKRIAMIFDNDHALVLHLMIAGRLRWRKAGSSVAARNTLAAFDFAAGSLVLSEAGKKRRASLHVVAERAALASFERGGLEVLDTDLATFKAVLARDNHTLKRALTSPGIVSGVGNAYSDEILFAARLSPFKQTRNLEDDEWRRLFEAARATLGGWVERRRAEVGEGFPDKLSAFHPEMAVHGRYRQPCRVCGKPVQRIVYAENESNYCAQCQTGGRVLADRSLSRLLKANWPRTVEELENS